MRRSDAIASAATRMTFSSGIEQEGREDREEIQGLPELSGLPAPCSGREAEQAPRQLEVDETLRARHRHAGALGDVDDGLP